MSSVGPGEWGIDCMRKFVLLAATAAFCLSAPALAGKPGNGGGNGGQGAGNGGNSQGNGGGNSGGSQGNGGNAGGNSGGSQGSGGNAGGNGGGSQGNGGNAGGNGGGSQGNGGNAGGNGGGGQGGGGTSTPIACNVHDISITAIACSGFYDKNLLSNSDIAGQKTGLQAIGFDWDGDFNGLVAAGNKLDANGATTLNFATPLSGITIMGIHFGGGGADGVGNGTAFYRFDAGTALNALDLFYQGSSGVVIYSTGRLAPPPPPEQGAVPEPASWAMMIAGFGLVGAAMRRQRTAVRFA